MSEQKITHKIIRNTVFNIIGRSWQFLVTIFLTPYIIRHLGVERYGIWVMVGVFTGYFGLLDLGVGFSFIKYISEFYAKKDYRKINQLINTGFVFYFFLSIIIMILAFFVIKPLILFLKIPANLQGEAYWVFLLGLFLFAIVSIMCPFMSIQSGLQKMDIVNKIVMAVSIPTIAGTIFVLEKGYGLLGLIVNSIVIFLLRSLATIIVNYKILPELKFNPLLFSREMFHKLFTYGYKIQVAYFASIMSDNFDKLLISYFLSIGLVTFYQLGLTIVIAARSITALLITPLIPAFSEIHAKEQLGKLIDGYTKGTKYFVLLVIPVFAFMIICANRLMIIWMGNGFEKSAWVIQILGIGWLFVILAGIASTVAQAIARTDVEMKSAIIAAVLNVPLSIILIKRFGFAGVAFGTMISLFCFAAYYFVKFHKIIDFPLANFLKITIFKPLFICLCIGLFVWKLDLILVRPLLDLSRINNLIILCMQAVIFLCLYLMALLFIKPLDNSDRAFLLDKFPFARNLIIKISH